MSRINSIGQSIIRAVRKTRPSGVPRAHPVTPRAKRPWPRASGLPLLGNAISMSGDVRSYLTEQYLQLGPVFQVRAFQHTFIVLAGPEANLFLLRHGKKYLRSLESWQEFNAELGATRSIVSMDGQEHFRLRRVLKGWLFAFLHRKTARRPLSPLPSGRSHRGRWTCRCPVCTCSNASSPINWACWPPILLRVNTWTTSSCS